MNIRSTEQRGVTTVQLLITVAIAVIVNGTGGFQAPFFDTNGGGNSLMQYDSAALRAALNVAGPRVLGFHEY